MCKSCTMRVGHRKYKMYRLELIESSYTGLCCTGYGLLVQDNVEILDALLSFSKALEKGLSRVSFP